MSDCEKLLSELFAAFPATRPASLEQLVSTTSDEEDDEYALTAAAFADKQDWTALDSTWLDHAADGLASALSFLSDEAICFYIPAYIAADAKGVLEHVDPVFHLTHGLDASSCTKRVRPDRLETWRDYAIRRWSHLTEAQARAVVHYLQWRLLHPRGWVDAGEINVALSSFWHDRAGTS